MIAKNICFTIATLFVVLHKCGAVGIRRNAFESKYFGVIHEETAGCGSLHEVGPDEKFYFNSKLIRSPFDSPHRRVIHYLDVSKGKVGSDSVVNSLHKEEPSGANPEMDTPNLPSEDGAAIDGAKGSPVDGESVSFIVPTPPNSHPMKIMPNRIGGLPPQSLKSFDNPAQKNLRKNSQKWRTDTSRGGGLRYNSLGKEIVEEISTVAPVTVSKKPHWSDRYYGKGIKESSIFEERSPANLQPRMSSLSARRDRRGFFSSRAHLPSGNAKKVSKRSIFTNTKKTEMPKGKHEICTWRFTAKPSCKQLVARLTRFKDKEIRCDKEHLLFKSHFDQMRFCNQKKFSGSFHAKGKTLIIEHKKILGAPESNFEGYVTCLDK